MYHQTAKQSTRFLNILNSKSSNSLRIFLSKHFSTQTSNKMPGLATASAPTTTAAQPAVKPVEKPVEKVAEKAAEESVYNAPSPYSRLNSDDLLALISNRRSTYTLSPETTIPDEQLMHILNTLLEQMPSTFASYTTRMTVALKSEHNKLWDATYKKMEAVTPPEQFNGHIKARIEGFRNAYGTILFFEDPTNTELLTKKMPMLAQQLPVWGQHTNAMHQFAAWVALTAEGLGVNLQHYSPAMDDIAREQLGVPAHWQLVAQMVFGKPTAAPGPKRPDLKTPVEDRISVHGM